MEGCVMEKKVLEVFEVVRAIITAFQPPRSSQAARWLFYIIRKAKTMMAPLSPQQLNSSEFVWSTDIDFAEELVVNERRDRL